MKPILNLIRRTLGRAITLIDSLASPKPLMRSPAAQDEVDRQTRTLALYQFEFCPFCIKVRRAMRRLNLQIELRNVEQVARFKEELLQGGGEYQVPCLRIEENGAARWLYESSDIIKFLEDRFAPVGA